MILCLKTVELMGKIWYIRNAAAVVNLFTFQTFFLDIFQISLKKIYEKLPASDNLYQT